MANEDQKPRDPIGSDLVKEDPSFSEIVVQFVEGLARRLATMEDAIRAGDFEALSTAAHQLKGSGGGSGYPILTERAAKLEQCARQHTIEDCTSAFAELRELCERVVVSDEE